MVYVKRLRVEENVGESGGGRWCGNKSSVVGV